jgi:SAM-dependent methyltransferase
MERPWVPADGADMASVYAGTATYYTRLVKRFGATPLGVDWSCLPTQELRFVQLLKLCDFAVPFSLNDLGCGYGSLVAYLERRHSDCTIDYLGVDLSHAMLKRARQLWRDRANVRFTLDHANPRTADYSIASGIFNVQLDRSRDEWEAFVAKTLTHLHQTSARGFAVNFMTAPTGCRVRKGLYTTEPSRWAQFLVARFGAKIRVVKRYGLREFTLIVRPGPS